MYSTGESAAMSGAKSKIECKAAPPPAKFSDVLAALALSPEVDIAVPASLWPSTPSPELCHAMASSASMLMFSLPGLDCLAPVFESAVSETIKAMSPCNKASLTACLPTAPLPTTLPTTLAEEETCSVCNDPFSMPPNCQDAVDCFSVDGKPTCQPCRLLFDEVPFVPKTQVCINPLCRRKWKQLTPKVLSSFCPPCMRHLEESLPAQQSGLEIASVECMYEHWHNIYAEIAEAVGYPAPGPKVVKAPETCESREQARKHWHNVLAAFEESFKSPPPSEEVRNWNSVYGRRKHYRGIIHRQNRRYCVAVEALEELSADLTPIRRVTTGMREFLLLDWQQQLHEGQEVNFVVCPNPSVDERDKVSRVVRLLGMPDKAEEKCASSLADLPASRSNSDIQTCSSGSSGSTTPPAFTDLMQWSQEALAEPEAPAAAKDNVPHALDCLPLGGNGALHQPPGINLHMSSSVHVLSAPPSRPRGNALFIPMGVRSSAMAAGLGSGHAQAGPGCSPLMDPRSPCAAYFGD
mmetsp:Transcript_68032/g.129408  ORF Transcript_68032/g.129408 Transcript_68032/m.129408 type:complete len:522 (-) Transcript_68032:245-1810(-)